MAYTAVVVSKKIERGQLHVTLEYCNVAGEVVLRDEMVSRSNQDEDWIQREVKRRLKDLEGIDALYQRIELGWVEVPSDVSMLSDPVTEKDEYKADLRRFEQFVSVLAKGLSTQENADFIALKKKLTDNFKSEYLNLF